ncbi:uncharacterized protein L969DRAFT_53879 [Mixia osmundae IAM 14324]|uniref:Uncharacterized protein n=1 Tax=Mixia osmundae (strain CBS 9802 / IAM 14324 / JCM 22182 / KY 12970) TaxID=764103 RepID=G7EAZ0_MIXOS|nr:uncharacterized protein L969DRAFT_53879 [Mixia osmundae IAM 14324]KEI37036.1 hypothetical protein L969DRAFT_53879 [Mixia osmundae IAM 14324]GAB00001.1 hypothetical protein E5Q_06703 [Mixia osmundae IAM 14324]
MPDSRPAHSDADTNITLETAHELSLDFDLTNLRLLNSAQLAIVQYHPDAEEVHVQAAEALWMRRRAKADKRKRDSRTMPAPPPNALPAGPVPAVPTSNDSVMQTINEPEQPVAPVSDTSEAPLGALTQADLPAPNATAAIPTQTASGSLPKAVGTRPTPKKTSSLTQAKKAEAARLLKESVQAKQARTLPPVARSTTEGCEAATEIRKAYGQVFKIPLEAIPAEISRIKQSLLELVGSLRETAPGTARIVFVQQLDNAMTSLNMLEDRLPRESVKRLEERDLQWHNRVETISEPADLLDMIYLLDEQLRTLAATQPATAEFHTNMTQCRAARSELRKRLINLPKAPKIVDKPLPQSYIRPADVPAQRSKSEERYLALRAQLKQRVAAPSYLPAAPSHPASPPVSNATPGRATPSSSEIPLNSSASATEAPPPAPLPLLARISDGRAGTATPPETTPAAHDQETTTITPSSKSLGKQNADSGKSAPARIKSKTILLKVIPKFIKAEEEEDVIFVDASSISKRKRTTSRRTASPASAQAGQSTFPVNNAQSLSAGAMPVTVPNADRRSVDSGESMDMEIETDLQNAQAEARPAQAPHSSSVTTQASQRAHNAQTPVAPGPKPSTQEPMPAVRQAERFQSAALVAPPRDAAIHRNTSGRYDRSLSPSSSRTARSLRDRSPLGRRPFGDRERSRSPRRSLSPYPSPRRRSRSPRRRSPSPYRRPRSPRRRSISPRRRSPSPRRRSPSPRRPLPPRRRSPSPRDYRPGRQMPNDARFVPAQKSMGTSAPAQAAPPSTTPVQAASASVAPVQATIPSVWPVIPAKAATDPSLLGQNASAPISGALPPVPISAPVSTSAPSVAPSAAAMLPSPAAPMMPKEPPVPIQTRLAPPPLSSKPIPQTAKAQVKETSAASATSNNELTALSRSVLKWPAVNELRPIIPDDGKVLPADLLERYFPITIDAIPSNMTEKLMWNVLCRGDGVDRPLAMKLSKGAKATMCTALYATDASAGRAVVAHSGMLLSWPPQGKTHAYRTIPRNLNMTYNNVGRTGLAAMSSLPQHLLPPSVRSHVQQTGQTPLDPRAKPSVQKNVPQLQIYARADLTNRIAPHTSPPNGPSPRSVRQDEHASLMERLGSPSTRPPAPVYQPMHRAAPNLAARVAPRSNHPMWNN